MTLDDKGKCIPGPDGCEGYLLWIALNEPKTMAALLALPNTRPVDRFMRCIRVQASRRYLIGVSFTTRGR
jgi:hypothetical protein